MSVDKQNIIQAKRGIKKEWAEDTVHLLAAFQNDSSWRAIVEAHVKSLYINSNNKEHINKHMQLVDIVRYIVEQMSTVHETSAEHALLDQNGKPIEGEDERLDIYTKLLEDTKYDDVTKQAEEWANLLNCCTVCLTPDFSANEFKMSIVEAPQIVVFQDPVFYDIMDKCQQVAVRMYSLTDSTETANDSEEQYWVYERNFDVKAGEQYIDAWVTNKDFDPIPDQPEDITKYAQYLTQYPVVHVQPKAPERGKLFREVPQDLLTIAKEIIWRMISRQYTLWVKQFEPYATSTRREEFLTDNAPNPGGAPGTIITGVENLSTVDWQPKTTDYLDDMRGVLKTFAQCRGLDKSFASDTKAPESGVSKYWDEKERIERRQKAAVYYADVEDNSLFPKMIEMAIMVGYPGADKLKGCRQVTTFPDPASEVSPEERRKLYQIDMQLGIENPLTIYAKENSLELDEARKAMESKGLKPDGEPSQIDRLFGGNDENQDED